MEFLTRSWRISLALRFLGESIAIYYGRQVVTPDIAVNPLKRRT